LKYFLLISIFVALSFAIEKNECQCYYNNVSEGTCQFSKSNEPICDISKNHKKEVEEKSVETQVGRSQGRNLIVNGGFEHGGLNWETFSFIPGSFWATQHGNSFFAESNLPPPPQGEIAMMNAAASGVSLVGLYQTFTWSDYSQCAFVKFDVSFQYFLRNRLSYYDPGTLFPTDPDTQVFRVDILDTAFAHLSNIYITDVGTPATTVTYKKHHSSFYVSTAANTNDVEFLRLRFGIRATRLRVGVDDVSVHATCLNFPSDHHEEHHEEHHENHHEEHHESHHKQEVHDEEKK